MWRGWGRVEVLFRPHLRGSGHLSWAGITPPELLHTPAHQKEKLLGVNPPTPPCSPKTVSVVVLMYLWLPFRLHLYSPAWVSWALRDIRYATPSQIQRCHPPWQKSPRRFTLQMGFQGAVGFVSGRC